MKYCSQVVSDNKGIQDYISNTYGSDQAIIKTLDHATAEGTNIFRSTTHDRISNICDITRQDPVKY